MARLLRDGVNHFRPLTEVHKAQLVAIGNTCTSVERILGLDPNRLTLPERVEKVEKEVQKVVDNLGTSIEVGNRVKKALNSDGSASGSAYF